MRKVKIRQDKIFKGTQMAEEETELKKVENLVYSFFYESSDFNGIPLSVVVK